MTWRVAQEEDERRVPPNEEYAVVEGHDDRRTTQEAVDTVCGRVSHDDGHRTVVTRS